MGTNYVANVLLFGQNRIRRILRIFVIIKNNIKCVLLNCDFGCIILNIVKSDYEIQQKV